MLIDWDMSVRLTAVPVIGMSLPMPPDFVGTLRTAVRKAKEWPREAVPSIFLEGKVNGKTILDRADIDDLSLQLAANT